MGFVRFILFNTFSHILIRVETGGEEEAQKRKTGLSCGVDQNYFLVIFSLFRNKFFFFDFATVDFWVVVSIGA